MTSITTSQVAESAQLERRRRRQLFLLVALVLVLLNPVGPDRNVFAVIGQSMRFEPVSPARLVDTRIDLGVERIDANTLRVQVAGVGDVPANAAATYVTVAATDASEQGYLVAYPTGEARPNSSNLNYQAGHTFSTGVIVGLGNSGSFDIYTLNPVNVVVDVTGVFVPDNSSAAGRFIPVSPSRLVDFAIYGVGCGGPDGERAHAVVGAEGRISGDRHPDFHCSEQSGLLHRLRFRCGAEHLDTQPVERQFHTCYDCDHPAIESIDEGVLVERRARDRRLDRVLLRAVCGVVVGRPVRADLAQRGAPTLVNRPRSVPVRPDPSPWMVAPWSARSR